LKIAILESSTRTYEPEDEEGGRIRYDRKSIRKE